MIAKGLLLLVVVIAALNSNNFLLPKSAFSEQEEKLISFGNNGTAHSLCNCVVFRMGDVQDYWIKSGQLTPMDLFLSGNHSLTLGIIMGAIGNDSDIVNKVRDGSQRGLFELAIHGWNHTDYTKLSEEKQRSSLYDANRKMVELFGKASQIFIPPYDQFNSDTLTAMSQVDLNLITGNTSSIADLSLNNNTSSILSSIDQNRIISY